MVNYAGAVEIFQNLLRLKGLFGSTFSPTVGAFAGGITDLVGVHVPDVAGCVMTGGVEDH